MEKDDLKLMNMIKNFKGFCAAVTAGTFLVGVAPLLPAQTLGPALEKMKRVRQSAPAPLQQASIHDPARVRTMLQAVHGFSRAGLDAASTDVPRILTTFIDTVGETLLMRRQAVKALALYPTDENLVFIEDRIGAAPLGLKRLYVTSLGAFAGNRPGRVAVALKPLLEDGDITVRYAAAGVAGQHKDAPAIRALLENRLVKEKNASLHNEIQEILKAK